MTDIADNIKTIKTTLEELCEDADRTPESVTLVAVSKKQPMARIEAALDAGHRVFGENRVQEAYAHWTKLKPRYPDLKLHLVGPLQSNKTKDAVALFDCIETVDRKKIVRKLAKEMKKQGRMIPCFIQVNTGEEEQKSGVAPDDLPDLLAYAREHELPVKGLMCIPPLDEPAALHFALLRKLAQTHKLSDLSMGMSGDFEKAVPLGATYIRLGTAVFGPRPNQGTAVSAA